MVVEHAELRPDAERLIADLHSAEDADRRRSDTALLVIGIVCITRTPPYGVNAASSRPDAISVPR
jgi:hypothetical protein